jgi:dGTPase
MLAADEGYLQHNRLTHSLKVAQVGRRIAENLLRTSDTPELKRAIYRRGGLSPDVVEAAGLAHDLGHPPFGHIAEERLQNLIEAHGLADSFEGNAQSFRIVTRLGATSTEFEGLDLTRATLNAILKYPWRWSSGDKKWGCYQSETDSYEWAREGYFEGRSRSLEADIMDWADDITYAIHDVEDFYRVGLVPLGRLRDWRAPDLPAILERTRQRLATESDPRYRIEASEGSMRRAWEETLNIFPMVSYDESATNRAKLNKYSSSLIGSYVVATGLRRDGVLKIPRPLRIQIAFLKELTKIFVVEAPALATQQQGQRRVVENLFKEYHAAIMDGVKRESADGPRLTSTLFPTITAESVQQLVAAKASAKEACRVVSDSIAGMTEGQALRINHRLMGFEFGSLVDPAVS